MKVMYLDDEIPRSDGKHGAPKGVTVGAVYVVAEDLPDSDHYSIINDDLKMARYLKDRFEVVDSTPPRSLREEFNTLTTPMRTKIKQLKEKTVDTVQPEFTVRLVSYPESNGKRNWTAQFVRKGGFDGLVGTGVGITFSHGELWNRVAFDFERARFLLGERDTEPFILDYGNDITTPDQWAGESNEQRWRK